MDFEYFPQPQAPVENPRGISAKQIEGAEREQFLEKVYKSGRAGFYTNFSGGRFAAHAGW